MRAALVGAVVLAGVPALAQQNDWSITHTAGGAVMEEASSLTFTVANAATSQARIDQFSLKIPNGPYDVEGASAPTGWRVATVDRVNRSVTFRAASACTPTSGLGPGQSNAFQVRVVGVQAAQDVPDALQLGTQTVDDVCNTRQKFRNPTGATGWVRHGFGAELVVSPRALDLGGQVTLTLAIVNRTSAVQTTIVPAAPVVRGAATFALVSGPTPAQVNSLAVDGTASFSWVYRATGRGVSTFEVSARNATTSSPTRGTLDVSVGLFPVVATVQPEVVVTGGEVALQVQVTNNTSTTLTAVTPEPLALSPTGAATATLVQGPTPASVGSLGAGTTTGFTYRYQVHGDPGDTLTFTARVRGTDVGGAALLSDPVRSATVSVSELTLTASPESVLSGAGATTIGYTVRNGASQAITSVVLLTPDTALFRTPTATQVPAGWTAATTNTPRGVRFSGGPLAPGAAITFTMAYASIGTVAQPTATAHRAQVTYADGVTTARADTRVTVATTRPVPDVTAPVAVARPGSVFLSWSNPAVHDGVLILRAAGAPPDTGPTQGRRYAQGDLLGNATVIYTDAFSFAGSFRDTAVTSGDTYFYRLYNRDEYSVYSPGHAPAAAPGNHLLVVVPGTGPSEPAWCASVGLPALQQPFTDLGRAVYQSSNGRYFTSNVISASTPPDGSEKWRPSLTAGVVEARPTVLRVGSDTEPSIFVGDKQGYAYRLSTVTGAIAWTGLGGAPLGEVIVAQAAVALREFATPAFQAAFSGDLVFFATRNTTSPASNSVRALRVDSGALAWTYQPGDLGQVVGAPLYDGFTQALWVASNRSAGPSLRVLDVVNPATPFLTVTDLGDVRGGVVRHGFVNQALVIDTTGKARGYHLGTRALLWELDVGGAVTTPAVPYQTDFFVSTSTGVKRYHVDAATNAVTQVWASAPLTAPTAARIDGANGRLYLGTGDGYLRRLTLATGALESSVRVSTTGGVSMPSLDGTAGLRRLYVGTFDGRLCALPPTF